MAMGIISILRFNSFGVYDHFGCLSGWKFNNGIKGIFIMEAIFTILIVVVMVFWACWSSYRTLTGKNGGCGCTGSCNNDDCVELPGKDDKS